MSYLWSSSGICSHTWFKNLAPDVTHIENGNSVMDSFSICVPPHIQFNLASAGSEYVLSLQTVCSRSVKKPTDVDLHCLPFSM